MNPMMKMYMSAQDPERSELFKKLHVKGDRAVRSKFSSQVELDRIYDELCQLFGWELYQDLYVMINKIWWNAQQWMGIVDGLNIAEETDLWLNNMLRSIKQLKTELKTWSIHSDILSVFAFLQAGEPDFGELIQHLNDLEEIILFCRDKIKFKRGEKYSKDKIQRHAVYGLFYLGEAIGLKHEPKPSKIYQFVHIITGIDPKQISSNHSDYKNIDLLQEIKQNRIFEYIFSPDYVTKELNQKMFPYMMRCPYKQTHALQLTLPVFPSVAGPLF